MATITKQKGKLKTSYKVRIRKPNNPTVTKTFSSKSLAEKWARKTELELEEGTYFEKLESTNHTVTNLVDRYLKEDLQRLAETDWHARKLQLNWWKNEIGHLTLNKVTPSILVECRNKLKTGITPRKKIRSGSTVNRYLAAMSAAFGIASSEWHWVKENPFAGIRREKENDSRVRFLSSEERTALLKACKESKTETLYLITLLALSTGMRQSEILTLTWEQIDFERCTITLYKTKNGEIRVVPIVGLASAKLQKHGKIRSLNNPHIFPGRHQSHAHFPRKAWEAAVQRSAVKDFHFHDTRHSAASELAMNGASLHEIAAVLGHKTLAMVQRYAHLSEQHTMTVVERMNKAVFGEG
ncbi:MAG: site-specific integrase [Gammaproteobacteria bacterium]|jgi:integrase|nr:site-specific integrase [Gammaproteobacteria bacterium]